MKNLSNTTSLSTPLKLRSTRRILLTSLFTITLLSPAFAVKRVYDGSGKDGPENKQIRSEQTEQATIETPTPETKQSNLDILSQLPDEVLANHILPQFVITNLETTEDASLIESAKTNHSILDSAGITLPIPGNPAFYVDTINAVQKLLELKKTSPQFKSLLTHKEIAKILNEAGIDINAPLKSAQEIPLNGTYRKSRQATSRKGTLLHVTIDAQNINFFWFLVFAGANLNATDAFKCTPIKYCDDIAFLDKIITTSESILVKLNLIKLTLKESTGEDLIEATALFAKISKVVKIVKLRKTELNQRYEELNRTMMAQPRLFQYPPIPNF